MKDLHSHFLYGVDDGSKSVESTRKMLEYAHSCGIKDIMFTPHYIKDSEYKSDKKNNMDRFIVVKEIALEFGINIYLGNEVFICNDLVDLIKSGEVATLNNSKYVLVEIPMYSKINNVENIFKDILENGYVPILAHPERYVVYEDHLDFFRELHDMGVLMQVNMPSIVGIYGRKAKSMAKKLLKAKLIDFVGSDIHSSHEKKYDKLVDAEHKIKRYVGKEQADNILFKNFDRVINNADIDI
jgi:protein-tyrosine phosphatase